MSPGNRDLKDALERHPCFNSDAHKKFARIHIPVAPKCNIQCNYCNRKFDCCNESRPGVTSEILSPKEAAVKIGFVREKIPELSVVGIAGPGDPMANESTFESLKIIHEEYPDLTLCVSTNGLALPDNAQRLYDLGVRFVTVTMNASDPEIGSRIYDNIRYDGKTLTGADASKILISKQTEGIRLCSEMGMIVKVNIVLIPGINDGHIPDLVKYVKSHGAYIVNILPLIPVEGTPFASLRSPTPLERKALMDACALDVRMMRHCRQCRADAVGLIGDDRSGEFIKFSGCANGCGPSQNYLKLSRDADIVAFASSNGDDINCGFGSTPSFWLYDISSGRPDFLKKVDIDLKSPSMGEDHKKHIRNIIDSLGNCGSVYVREIGEMPSKTLDNLGIKVFISSGKITDYLNDLTNPSNPS